MTRLMFRVVALAVISSARAAGFPFTIALVTGPVSPQTVVTKEVVAWIVKDTDGHIGVQAFAAL